MRIGTWNLEGRWSPEHEALLVEQACEVWLLTEVHISTTIPGMQVHRTAELMGPQKSWAAVASTGRILGEPDPHRATASAEVAGTRFICSVLPWRACGTSWQGSTLAEKQAAALLALQPQITAATVWGGDWNQALEGPEFVGCLEGRRIIDAMLGAARLSVPTRSLGSASPEHRAIDHVAVPVAWDVSSVHRVKAIRSRRRLSDHDAYLVDAEPNQRT